MGRLVVGLIPAAGFATRLPGISGSKEVLPLPRTGEPVVSHALRAFARAGIVDVALVLRPEKGDIRRALGRGDEWGVRIEYVETEPTLGPAHSIAKAHEQVRGADVAFAFPDILMESPDPYSLLLASLRSHATSGVLGLFPRSRLQAADPVVVASGRVVDVLPKDRSASTPWCWGAAVWSPDVTDHLHERWRRNIDRDGGASGDTSGEWSLGRLFRDVLEAGFTLSALPVSDAPFLDVGTPTGLRWAMDGLQSPPATTDGGSKGSGQDSD